MKLHLSSFRLKMRDGQALVVDGVSRELV